MRMSIPPRRARPRGMNGLGQWETLIPVAANWIAGKSGGGGGSAGGGAMPISVTTTVSPSIQTQVSPQISPVFQQSYMPSNSGQTAGTTQVAPTQFSASGTKPGSSANYIPNAYGEPMPGLLDPSTYGALAPSTPSGVYTQGTVPSNKTFWVIAAIAAAVGVYLLYKGKGKKKHDRHSESVRHKADDMGGDE